MGTINIQSTDLSHKAGLTYTGTSDKTIDVNNVLQTSDTTASIASGKVVVNSSGNVGIGTTSPSDRFSIGSNTTRVSHNGYPIEVWGSNVTTGEAMGINLHFGYSGENTKNVFMKGVVTSAYANTVDLVVGTMDTERMRIDSAGNLLIGTTTNNGVDKLQINGTISSGTARFVSDLNGLKNSLGQFLTGDFTWNGATGAPCTFGTVHQISRGTSECTQFAIDMVTANLYSRRCLSGTWTSWRTI